MTAPAAADARDRVLGWDVLRGLCALAVALYHLLYWQGLANLHSLGSYGVYLFFVLSGASLAYTYTGRMRRRGDYAAFLMTRWLRLAPLYIVLCLVFLAFLAIRNGAWVGQIPQRLLLNATFAFGAYDPVTWALLIGGWSLGIEFLYYLAFPLLLPAVKRLALWLPLVLALALLQWSWILRTVGSDAGYAASAVAYHQVPAFGAYFFGGCVIGYWRSLRDLRLRQDFGLAAWASMAALLLAITTPEAGGELLGVRGALAFAACFAVVWVSGNVSVQPRLAPVARWLGDITYGCYLLHPLFFFGFLWFVWPHLNLGTIEQSSWLLRSTIVLSVVGFSCAAAAASERWFESPLRRWGKRILGRRLAPVGTPQSEAASISS